MTERDENIRIEGIQSRLDLTDQRPWRIDWTSDYPGATIRSAQTNWIIGETYEPNSLNNAILMANAPIDIEFLLGLVEEQQKLIEIMRQDGTEAQDQAKKEEKARIVAWLRTGADEFERDEYHLSSKTLYSFADALEAQT